MYDFAVVALLGLALAKVMDLVSRLTGIEGTVRVAGSFVVAVLAVWAIDYSVFASWEIDVRETWMGPVFTGLVVAGLGAAWDQLLDALAARVGGARASGTRIESTTPRQAA